MLIRGPRRLLGADDDVEDVLERAREHRALRQGFLRRAADAVSQLGAELADEDARLEAEGLRLAEERRKLKVAISLARHQHDLEDAKAEASRVASREACSRDGRPTGTALPLPRSSGRGSSLPQTSGHFRLWRESVHHLPRVPSHSIDGRKQKGHVREVPSRLSRNEPSQDP